VNVSYDCIEEEIKMLKDKVRIILEAELKLIAILSILQKEDIPNKNYIKNNMEWIFYEHIEK